MTNEQKRHEKKYSKVAMEDGTYTVEVSDGTNEIIKVKGFPNKAAADAWIAEQKRLLEANPGQS